MKRFVLLRDFHHAYDAFPLKVLDPEDWLGRYVIDRLVAAIDDAVDELILINPETVSRRIAESVDDRHFVVTLDGGTYFRDYQFSFEITRTCFDMSRAHGGDFPRYPRSPRPQFFTQAMQLLNVYQSRGQNRPVLLCDDGIDTGDSLREIIRYLGHLNMPIDRIAVLLNQHGIDRLDNEFEVTTILDDVSHPYEWLSERDLIWGLPRSGLSFTQPEEVSPRYGIPYTVDDEMVRQRIKIGGDAAGSFRRAVLEANVEFWDFLDTGHNRVLCFEDCERLAFLTSLVGEGTPVTGLLKRLAVTDGLQFPEGFRS